MAQGCSNKSPNMLTVESTKRNFKIFILASVLSTRCLLLLRATLVLFATLSTYQVADDWGQRSVNGSRGIIAMMGRLAQSQLYLKLLGLLPSWHTWSIRRFFERFYISRNIRVNAGDVY